MPDLLLANIRRVVLGIVSVGGSILTVLTLLGFIPWARFFAWLLDWLCEPTPMGVTLAVIVLYFTPWRGIFGFLVKILKRIWGLIEDSPRYIMKGERLPRFANDTPAPKSLIHTQDAGTDEASDDNDKGAALPPGEPQHDPKKPAEKGEQ